MVSYIELVNRFWQVDEQYSFSGNETRLYFYLLKIANNLRWPDEFDYADEKLTGNLGVRINTLKPCRERLVEAGLVDFTPGGKGRGKRVRYQLRYQILTPKAPERCQESYQNLTPLLIPKDDKVSEKLSKIDTYSYIVKNKTLSESNINAEIENFQPPETEEKKGTPPPTPTPRGDPFLRNRNAESLNVPFSQWWPLYQKAIREQHCKKLWAELTDTERETALTHTPLYVASKPDKSYRLNPENYLEQKAFNDEIIARHGKPNQSNQNTARVEPIPGKSFGNWRGTRFGITQPGGGDQDQ